jgi:uncharacterized protein YaaQ
LQAEQKLLVIIASNDDADALIRKLVERGYPATKVSSTGGFLKRGNATIFSGVGSGRCDRVIAIIRSECRARTEMVPVPALPLPGHGAWLGRCGWAGRLCSCCRWSGSEKTLGGTGEQRNRSREQGANVYLLADAGSAPQIPSCPSTASG